MMIYTCGDGERVLQKDTVMLFGFVFFLGAILSLDPC